MIDPSQDQTIRTFLGVPLAGRVLQAAEDMQARLRRRIADPSSVKWERPENMHLTLHFLGPTDHSQLPEIVEALDRVGEAHKPFELVLGGPGWLPGRGKPRVMVVSLEAGAHELTALQASIAHELTPVGFPADSRPFRPHVTLGRVKRKGAKLTASEADRLCEPQVDTVPPAQMTVKEVVFFQSELTPEGAIYSHLATLDLQAS